MTRPFLFPCALAAAAILVGLGGCELLKHNDEVLSTINKRVIGMPAGAFFDRYGRPNVRGEMPDGGTAYEWISSVGYAVPGPEGLDDRLCKLRLTADREGRISAVIVQYDGIGQKSTSRCGEIFAAP